MSNYTQESVDQNSHRRRAYENGSQRSSRRRSDVRHGRIYEASPETLIRAVTPDSAVSLNPDITALPSPNSYQAANQMRFQTQDPTASVSNTDEESTIEHRRRKSKKKSGHPHAGQQETSPNSFFEKTRKRLNSITTTSSSSPRQEDSAVSIGFPSVVQASVFPDLQDLRQQLPRTPRRTYSSDTTATLNTPILRSPLILDYDVNKILQLMKSTCGRMHGILFYRPIGTTAWNSGYCAINVGPGSLVCQMKGGANDAEILIPDLRGCTVRTQYDSQSRSTHLSVVLPISGLGYQLRPPVPETFESWLAALLCWQPLRPKGVHNKMTKPQSIVMHDRQTLGSRRLSDIASSRSTTIVKTGQMYLWDAALPAGSVRHHNKKRKLSVQDPDLFWKRVNCTLHENGTLRLLAEENAVLIRSIKLNDLARCAIQRLDESVLDVPHCIAIHPQYSISTSVPPETNPLVLSLESRIAFEAWFVLLRAMTVPELYGPATDAVISATRDRDLPMQSFNMFRIERSLRVKIVEVKATKDIRHNDMYVSHDGKFSSTANDGTQIYADIILGRDLRARTATKQFKNSIFWAEEFCLEDIPSASSKIAVILKLSNPDEKEWTMVPKNGYELPVGDHPPDVEPAEVAASDPLYGKVNVLLSDLEQDKLVEKWWQLTDTNGIHVGQALIKLSLEENVVLLEAEYAELSALLHNFDNSLTSQLGQLLSSELKQLSDVLLDIFQCSGKAEDWINNLVEEEIDGIYREEPPIRTRFAGRVRSNDSHETGEKREMFVRDLSRSATTEANLLFRGNSLVTKALEAHMRRTGKEYLERTIGENIRTIVAEDPDCEVDPIKVRSPEQLERNWSRLIGLTSSIWQSISVSVSRCPPGMRNILKHVRSCAEDRYGSFIRTVKYTSVSGFLFLRFFCPAILNPRLFGLLEDHPPERARRSFTLIAKSLIVLANMSRFGQKEPWMEPMNRFLSTATADFKNFIEEFCSWDAGQGPHHEPQYQAALQVKQRLPPLSREGLPSLPFLLDAPTSIATLVDVWAKNAPADLYDSDVDECVTNFNKLCLKLKQKSLDCMANAEKAQEPNSNLERQWQKMLSEQQRTRTTINPFEDMIGNSDITALPQAQVAQENYSRRHQYRAGFGVADNSPTAGERRESEAQTMAGVKSATHFTNSSSTSFDIHDEYRIRQGARSRDGSTRSRMVGGRIESASNQDFLGRG